MASAARSFHPIWVSGHPSASAIGRGIAITRGDVAIEAASVGTTVGRSWARACSVATSPQADEAGDHTWGCGPSTSGSQPRASAVAAVPEPLRTTWATTHVPST